MFLSSLVCGSNSLFYFFKGDIKKKVWETLFKTFYFFKNWHIGNVVKSYSLISTKPFSSTKTCGPRDCTLDLTPSISDMSQTATPSPVVSCPSSTFIPVQAKPDKPFQMSPKNFNLELLSFQLLKSLDVARKPLYWLLQ